VGPVWFGCSFLGGSQILNQVYICLYIIAFLLSSDKLSFKDYLSIQFSCFDSG